MRFIVESSFLSDYSDWAARVFKRPPGMGNTQIRDVTANRLPEVAPERNGHGHRVNTRRRSHLRQAYPARIFGLYRVTENDGKKTPGVDQEIWDTPEKKTQAVHALKRRGYQSQPLRRVYIPKSDGRTMRPLGIPTMKDRAQQALYLLALAPVVETTADKNSYGFRTDWNDSCRKDIRQENVSSPLEVKNLV
jgi:RNA-directed DNA polymerase